MTRDEKWLLEEKYGGTEKPEFAADKTRLAQGEPLAYIIGYEPFLGLRIYLDSHPLIPRPETEWWVESMLNTIIESGADQGFSFLDLCAGSGAIGCAVLARCHKAHVSFGEIDPTHRETIEKNIRENNLDLSQADIRLGDLFMPFGNQTFDFIAANPPYIPKKRMLDESVRDFEPGIALFGGEDGLSVIRTIAKELPLYLRSGGTAWIECDSAHAEAACALFSAEKLGAQIRTDQYGVPRFIVVSFK